MYTEQKSSMIRMNMIYWNPLFYKLGYKLLMCPICYSKLSADNLSYYYYYIYNLEIGIYDYNCLQKTTNTSKKWICQICVIFVGFVAQ